MEILGNGGIETRFFAYITCIVYMISCDECDDSITVNFAVDACYGMSWNV